MSSHLYRSLSSNAVARTSSLRDLAHSAGDLLVVVTKDVDSKELFMNENNWLPSSWSTMIFIRSSMSLTTKFNRDNSDYKFNGVVYSKKKALVTDVLLHYISEHPEATKADIHKAFHIKSNMETAFMDEKAYYQYYSANGKAPSFFKEKEKLKDEDYIKVADTRLLVSSNWPLTSQGRPAEFSAFLDACRKIGCPIVVA